MTRKNRGRNDPWKNVPHFLRPDVTPVTIRGVPVQIETPDCEDESDEREVVRTDTLTTKQAATVLNIAPETLETWRSQGKGPQFHRAGRRVLYLPEDLREWLKGHQVSPSGRSPSGRSPR